MTLHWTNCLKESLLLHLSKRLVYGLNIQCYCEEYFRVGLTPGERETATRACIKDCGFGVQDYSWMLKNSNTDDMTNVKAKKTKTHYQCLH